MECIIIIYKPIYSQLELIAMAITAGYAALETAGGTALLRLLNAMQPEALEVVQLLRQWENHQFVHG